MLDRAAALLLQGRVQRHKGRPRPLDRPAAERPAGARARQELGLHSMVLYGAHGLESNKGAVGDGAALGLALRRHPGFGQRRLGITGTTLRQLANTGSIWRTHPDSEVDAVAPVTKWCTRWSQAL